jgi:hypothetical protein
LVRFSDRFNRFLFVDLGSSAEEAAQALRDAVAHSCRGSRGVPGLTLDGLEIHRGLCAHDFEMDAPHDVLRRAASVLGPDLEVLRPLVRVAAGTDTEQWGIRATLTRQIPHADGTVEKRPLRLQMVAGEGLLTWIALGGLAHAPLSVGTVQTGLAERHDGPLARLFARQARMGGALPEVWIRGREGRPPWDAWPDWGRLEPASPFHVRGASYPSWISHQRWPGVSTFAREVSGWIRTEPDLRPIPVGPHVLDPRPIDATDVFSVDVASIPHNLARTLGVTVTQASPIDLSWRILQANDFGSRLHALTSIPERPRRQNRHWTPPAPNVAFQTARTMLLVPHAREDELSVLIRWIRSFERPAVRVSLPMPLDWLAAQRAALDGAEDRGLRVGIEDDPWLCAA